ncbi:hypothetical protein OG730_16430 [Streptomyces sp. NBC_01298]|uniref:hypothetical protein n=1 Tax=Streptomyces sp. NBC_01298 TaxID=2903817 RepID=UPI002E0F61EA|nr:hypothetical protein OG730_16430 [Streptomyces sp. NBC_01298]
MRTALRTSIVTAALAGALLAPAAGTAFAAPAPHSVAGAKAAASPIAQVKIGDNLVAHMSNSAEQGPRVSIHIVKDGVPSPEAMTTLDRSHTKYSNQGTTFTLTKAQTAEPVLTVFVANAEGGTTTSFPLPKGTAGAPAPCVSEVKTVAVGPYMAADLTMSSKGPRAVVRDTDGTGDDYSLTLDREHPKGPDSYYLRIENPFGAKPVFQWKTQGGDAPVLSASFPALPKGCKLEGTKPTPKPSTTPAKPKPGPQTVVVPKGPVAAGAELPVETVTDTDNSTTVAAGAGLIAVFGALGAGLFLRRRTQG